MSVQVQLGQLAKQLEEHRFAYLVTVGDEGRAHVLAVTPQLTGAALSVAGIGRHSVANASARPQVTLVWPPSTDGGYSLIVDGTATVGDGTLTVTPSKAILHRPAPGDDGLRAGSDCEPVTLTDG